jgi:predicted lipoprotein with Yx(FWY)xxD motif
MKRLSLLAAPLVAAALLLAACGGSSSGGSSTSSGSGAAGPYGGGNATTMPAEPSSGGEVVKVTNGPLGTYLVDGEGRALYLFKADGGTKSTCNGACAQAWPPVTTTGAPKAGTGTKSSLLGTTKRADGSTEVTYAGHPLYYYAGDSGPGETNGQGSNGFGAPWWVVTPSGQALTS